MKLIICEKPSLGKNVANAIGNIKKNNGYLECDEYIVSWAFGHLFVLKDIKEYLGINDIKWKDIQLPYIPEEFEFKIKNDSGVKKQFKILKEIIKNNNITEIINCGDADREGQIIVDIIITKLNFKGKVSRLWLPEQTKSTIIKALSNLEDNKNYLNLSTEGYARMYLDWLLGVNYTILSTIKKGKLMNVGRVMIPIVDKILERDLEIETFRPETFYKVISETYKKNINVENTFGLKSSSIEIPIRLEVQRKFKLNEKQELSSLIDELNSSEAYVTKIEKKVIKKLPSKLFSLSKLQSLLSSKYKMNFETSSKIIQSLYEKQLVTYPRTNTEYLAVNEKEKILTIFKNYPKLKLTIDNNSKIFDDSKIESHSAITITNVIPEKLEEDEEKVYRTIFNRFISNFLDEETTLLKTEVEISVSTEKFKLKGETIEKEGYFKYEPQKLSNELPLFYKGETFKVNFKAHERETVAPNKITETTLSNFLKAPFKKSKTSEDEEYKAILEGLEIGTEATRTAIISKCITKNYISRKGQIFSITEDGKILIDTVKKLNIDLFKERNVEISKLLKSINKGEITLKKVIKLIQNELDKTISQNIQLEKVKKEEKEIIGICPKCGSPVYEGITKSKIKNYYCSDFKNCDFKLWEQTRHFRDEIKITKTKAKALLKEKGKAKFKIKDKEVYLSIVINGKWINFKTC